MQQPWAPPPPGVALVLQPSTPWAPPPLPPPVSVLGVLHTVMGPLLPLPLPLSFVLAALLVYLVFARR
jgi:hypothetical protein